MTSIFVSVSWKKERDRSINQWIIFALLTFKEIQNTDDR